MVSMASVVASSSTLWAQASKEWVIPAKPKPGRKPKKDPPAPPVDESMEPDSKGRRVQNRAAQRAFRERKQSQLADLQARVQSYEQGEMERNVALQNIAKRLKEENEALRKENASLREELRKIRPEKSPETERKRWREDSTTPYASRDITTRKRIKTDGLSLSPDSIPSSAMSLLTSPSSIVSSPESDSAASSVHNDPYSPMSFSARSPNSQVYPQHNQQPAMASLFSGFSGKVPGCINEHRGANSYDPSFDMVDCGFCSEDTPCVCRELALQQVAARIAVHGEVPGSGPSIPTNSTSTTQVNSHSPPEVKMESRGSISISSTPQISPATVPIQPLSANNSPSILDNLPAYSPPVPLPRRRPSEQTSSSPVFPIFPVQPLSARPLRPTRSTSPSCTGDPSNCLACADDPFGKAFCAALGGSVKECASCPDNVSPVNSGFVGCGGCGNPGLCGGTGSNSDRASLSSGAPRSAPMSSTSSPGHLSANVETIPCNTAWAQLKSHPNIAFADLTLLADVVARRSKCNGPRIVLSPDPEMETPGRRQSDGRTADRGSDDMPILLTDPHAQYHEHTQSRSQSGRDSSSSTSSEVILQCGRQRVVEVEADGVRDALAMLDGQYQRG